MTVWKVDKRFYGPADDYEFYVMPYSLKGTLMLYFGYDFKHLKPRFHYYPWTYRYKSLFQFLVNMRFTEESAKKLAKKKNSKIPKKT